MGGIIKCVLSTELQTRKERLCSKLLGAVVDTKLFQKKEKRRGGGGLERGAVINEEGRVAVEMPFRGDLPEQRPEKLRSGETATSSKNAGAQKAV